MKAASPRGISCPALPTTDAPARALVKGGAPEANPQRQVPRTPGKGPLPNPAHRAPGPLSRLARGFPGSPPALEGLARGEGRTAKPLSDPPGPVHPFKPSALVQPGGTPPLFAAGGFPFARAAPAPRPSPSAATATGEAPGPSPCVRRTFLTGAVPDSYTFNGHVTNVYDWRLLQSNRGPAIHAHNIGTLDRPASHPFCGPASGRRFAPVRLAFESPPFRALPPAPPVASKPRDTPCRLTPKRETLGVQKNDRFVEPAVGHPLRPTCLRPPVAWVGWAPFPPRPGEPYRRPMGLRLGPDRTVRGHSPTDLASRLGVSEAEFSAGVQRFLTRIPSAWAARPPVLERQAAAA